MPQATVDVALRVQTEVGCDALHGLGVVIVHVPTESVQK